MMRGYKLGHVVCKCGKRMQDVITPIDEPEPWVSIYPCEYCEYPERAEKERQDWIEENRKLFELEIKDAQGNIIKPSITTCRGGEWVTYWTFDEYMKAEEPK